MPSFSLRLLMEHKLPISRNKALYATVAFLGLLSFTTCVAAEFKKNQLKDLKLDAKFCSLPKSPAFELGITAAACLLCAQVITYASIAKAYFSKDTKAQFGERMTTVLITLSLLSWGVGGLAIVLLGVGSSMNQRQPYGEGWLDGECYVVRRGVYSGASLLAIVTVASALTVHCAINRRHEGAVMADARLPTTKKKAPS
ncbi:protein MODIFYING WALL LIGNIN-1-like [Nymphaea colorata]|nr:protein MODIFYING WALL LIGNIN-1-like [Nymphaea colorata]